MVWPVQPLVNIQSILVIFNCLVCFLEVASSSPPQAQQISFLLQFSPLSSLCKTYQIKSTVIISFSLLIIMPSNLYFAHQSNYMSQFLMMVFIHIVVYFHSLNQISLGFVEVVFFLVLGTVLWLFQSVPSVFGEDLGFYQSSCLRVYSLFLC